MKALIHENTHLVLDPLLNWQPVQLVTNISSEADVRGVAGTH